MSTRESLPLLLTVRLASEFASELRRAPAAAQPVTLEVMSHSPRSVPKVSRSLE